MSNPKFLYEGKKLRLPLLNKELTNLKKKEDDKFEKNFNFLKSNSKRRENREIKYEKAMSTKPRMTREKEDDKSFLKTLRGRTLTISPSGSSNSKKRKLKKRAPLTFKIKKEEESEEEIETERAVSTVRSSAPFYKRRVNYTPRQLSGEYRPHIFRFFSQSKTKINLN